MLFFQRELRRHVNRCPAKILQFRFLCIFDSRAEAKIYQFRLFSISIDQNVLKFEVSMDHILRVHVFYGLNYAGEDLFYFVFILNSLTRHFSDVLIKVVSIHVFNDDRDFVSRVYCIIKPHYAAVVQSTQYFNFLPEGLNPLIILKKRASVILLDCNLLTGAFDETALDGAEGSLTYQHLNIIIFESCQVWTIQAY